MKELYPLQCIENIRLTLPAREATVSVAESASGAGSSTYSVAGRLIQARKTCCRGGMAEKNGTAGVT
jgi:hypothetical protein